MTMNDRLSGEELAKVRKRRLDMQKLQEIEGNPLVAWYLAALGPAVGFTAAKLFAVMCGVVLYVTAHHRLVAILTLVYLVFAVAPWFALLSVSV